MMMLQRCVTVEQSSPAAGGAEARAFPATGSRLRRLGRALLMLATVVVSSGSGVAAAASGGPPPIRSAAEDDYPPFSMVGSDGRATGFAVELMRASAAAMGRETTFRSGPWPEVRGWLERGEIDALPLVGRTPEREPLFDFTVPYMTLHGAIVVRADTDDIAGLGDLRRREVAVMAGDNAEEFVRRTNRGMDVTTYPSFEDALVQLAAGRHDAVVMQRLVAVRLLDELGLDGLRVVNRPVEEFSQDFCFAVQEGDRDTLALLNEGLALVIADGTYRQLHAKWFAAMELPTDRRIVVGGDEAFPPFEFLDDDGRPAGLNVDLTRAIARVTGLDVEIRLGPWAEVRRKLERGELDALQGMFSSPRRDAMVDFTPPHTSVHYVGVVRRGERSPPEDLAECAGSRIVVQAGDIMHDLVVAEGLGDDVTAVLSQEEALRELAGGRHDVALVSRAGAAYWIEHHGWSGLEVGHDALLSPDYCYAVANGHKALLAQLSEGLRLLEESGEYRRIYDRWMGVYQPDHVTLADALRRSGLVIGLLVLGLLLVFLWLRLLRRQVAIRTAELRESERRLATLLGNLPGMAYRCRNLPSWTMEFISDGCSEMTGYSPDELVDDREIAYGELIHPDDRVEVWDRVQEAVASGEQFSLEYRLVTRGGDVRWVWEKGRAVPSPDAGQVRLEGFISDITERRALEEQLLQSQKMESIGRLAGGIAHDYNNMLTVIIGKAELALTRLDEDHPVRGDVAEILAAARRSSEITRQLLGFARKQSISPRRLDLNRTIERMLSMLRRLIGEDVALEWCPGRALGEVFVDPVQVDQILTNLCVNARHAIEGVGRIVIATRDATLDRESARQLAEVAPGEYVVLSVTDDGCGMDEATRERVFEPFFTTKAVGEGTGLGLATVYGIVSQNGGFVDVSSEPGTGTTFEVHLPRVAGATEPEPGATTAASQPAASGHGETVLVVEDDPAILGLISDLLDGLGYRVLATATPHDAVALAQKAGPGLDLLVTDVVMPEMDGHTLAKMLHESFPDLPVLFISGHAADVVALRGKLDTDAHFLQKPFTTLELAAKVREVLAGT